MLKKICLIIVLLVAFFITSHYAEADSNYICNCSGNTMRVTSCDQCPVDCTSCTFQPPANSIGGGSGSGAPAGGGTGSGGAPSAPVKLTNPLTGNATSKDIPTLLGNIISYAMGIIGSLALVMFIFGGATWMLSAGNQERVTKGKNIIIWAALGLAMIFTAYALVKFVIETLGKSGS